MLRRLIYSSKASAPMSEVSLLNLLHLARDLNLLDNITGLLLYNEGHFLQLIEGPEAAISNLEERLEKDKRHKDILIHQDLQTDTRLFPDWSMGWGDLSNPALTFLPGLARPLKNQDRFKSLANEIASFSKELQSALAEMN